MLILDLLGRATLVGAAFYGFGLLLHYGVHVYLERLYSLYGGL